MSNEADEINNAASKVLEGEPKCIYCGSDKGHYEIVETLDEESLHGHELWMCCHQCRDKGQPCETFFRLHKQELKK